MMKLVFTGICFSFFALAAHAQTANETFSKPDATIPVQPVEVSCGKCKFGLAGKTCELAVRINEKAYYVDGAKIDDYGDAHDDNGLCNAIRQAEVQGKVDGNRYKVSYLKLLPVVKTDVKQ